MKSFKDYILESRQMIQKPTDSYSVDEYKEIIDSITDDPRVTAEIMTLASEFFDNDKVYVIDSSSSKCSEDFKFWTSDDEVFKQLQKPGKDIVSPSSVEFYRNVEVDGERFMWAYNMDSGEFVIVCNKEGVRFKV